jgi:outer membrane protein assembly factor BamB
VPTIFIAVPGSTPKDEAAAADGRLFLATKNRLQAFEVAEGRLLWESSHAAPESVFYRVPRRIRASGKILRPLHDGLLHLSDGDADVIVRCHDAMTGRVRWERRTPTPAPLSWTEPAPACEGAKTEEIDAYLPLQIPGLAVARTTRTSTHSLPGQGTFPAPPYEAQLEILSLDGASGRDRWMSTLPNIGVPILEKNRFSLLLRRGLEILDVDPESGRTRLIGHAPKPCAWPRRAGGKAITAWRTTKGFGLTAFDGHDVFLARKNTRDVALHEAGSRLVLQFNERSFSVVQSDLRVGPEIPIKGYIYGVAASPDGLLGVATAGAGGGLYAVDPTSGVLVAEQLLPQGAWQPVTVLDAGKTVAVCGPGVAILDVRSGRLTLEELPGAGAIAGVHGRRVAVWTGEPAPAGIHLLDL